MYTTCYIYIYIYIHTHTPLDRWAQRDWRPGSPRARARATRYTTPCYDVIHNIMSYYTILT